MFQVISQEVSKKAFENDPSQKMIKLSEKNKISVSIVPRMVKKMRGKRLTSSRKPLLSAAMVQKRLEKIVRLLTNLKNHGNQILIFFRWKTLTGDYVFNKQNDRVVTIRNDVSEHRGVSTNKQSASIIMFGVAASNGENMLSVWFERSYRITSAVYRKALETKVLLWIKKIIKKSDYIFQQNGAPAHMAKIMQDWLDANVSFWSKDFSPYRHHIWTLSTSVCGLTLKKWFIRHATATQMSSMFLCTAHGSRWRKGSLRRSARASDLD